MSAKSESRFQKFCKSNTINWLRVTLIALTAACLLYATHYAAKQVYYRGFYSGCIKLATSTLFDAEQSDYLMFKCNFETKRRMFAWGDLDEILLFSDVWPDKGE